MAAFTSGSQLVIDIPEKASMCDVESERIVEVRREPCTDEGDESVTKKSLVAEALRTPLITTAFGVVESRTSTMSETQRVKQEPVAEEEYVPPAKLLQTQTTKPPLTAETPAAQSNDKLIVNAKWDTDKEIVPDKFAAESVKTVAIQTPEKNTCSKETPTITDLRTVQNTTSTAETDCQAMVRVKQELHTDDVILDQAAAAGTASTTTTSTPSIENSNSLSTSAENTTTTQSQSQSTVENTGSKETPTITDLWTVQNTTSTAETDGQAMVRVKQELHTDDVILDQAAAAGTASTTTTSTPSIENSNSLSTSAENTTTTQSQSQSTVENTGSKETPTITDLRTVQNTTSTAETDCQAMVRVKQELHTDDVILDQAAAAGTASTTTTSTTRSIENENPVSTPAEITTTTKSGTQSSVKGKQEPHTCDEINREKSSIPEITTSLPGLSTSEISLTEQTASANISNESEKFNTIVQNTNSCDTQSTTLESSTRSAIPSNTETTNNTLETSEKHFQAFSEGVTAQQSVVRIKPEPQSMDQHIFGSEGPEEDGQLTPERPAIKARAPQKESTAPSITVKTEPIFPLSDCIPEDFFDDLIDNADQLTEGLCVASPPPPLCDLSGTSKEAQEPQNNELSDAQVRIKNEPNEETDINNDDGSDLLANNFFDDLLVDHVAERSARIADEAKEIKYSEQRQFIQEKLRQLDEEGKKPNHSHKHREKKSKSKKKSRKRRERSAEEVNSAIESDCEKLERGHTSKRKRTHSNSKEDIRLSSRTPRKHRERSAEAVNSAIESDSEKLERGQSGKRKRTHSNSKEDVRLSSRTPRKHQERSAEAVNSASESDCGKLERGQSSKGKRTHSTSKEDVRLSSRTPLKHHDRSAEAVNSASESDCLKLERGRPSNTSKDVRFPIQAPQFNAKYGNLPKCPPRCDISKRETTPYAGHAIDDNDDVTTHFPQHFLEKNEQWTSAQNNVECLTVKGSSSHISSGFKRIKLEKPPVEEKPAEPLVLTMEMKRQKAFKLAADTLSKFQEAQKNPYPGKFNFASTVCKLLPSRSRAAVQAYNNRSPLHSINNVDYDFNSLSTHFNLHDYGLQALPKLSAKIACTVGCNAEVLFRKLNDMRLTKQSTIIKQEPVDNSEPVVRSSLFINAVTQTDHVRVISVGMGNTGDIGVQVKPMCGSIATQTTATSTATASNDDLPLMQLINVLNENQLMALNDFAELINEPATTAMDVYRLRTRMQEIYKCSQLPSALAVAPVPAPVIAPAFTLKTDRIPDSQFSSYNQRAPTNNVPNSHSSQYVQMQQQHLQQQQQLQQQQELQQQQKPIFAIRDPRSIARFQSDPRLHATAHGAHQQRQTALPHKRTPPPPPAEVPVKNYGRGSLRR